MADSNEPQWHRDAPAVPVDRADVARRLRRVAVMCDAGPLSKSQSAVLLSLLYADLVDLRRTFAEYRQRPVRLAVPYVETLWQLWEACRAAGRSRDDV